VKSENLFGETFGRITEASALKQYHQGRDLPIDVKYQTVTQMTYTKQLRIPVMPLRPKVYPPPPEDAIDQIPPTTLAKFYGVHDPRNRYEVSKALDSFYQRTVDEDSGLHPEDLGTAHASFWGETGTAPVEEETKLSYEEARKLAAQLKS
jgi:hypothetical protein